MTTTTTSAKLDVMRSHYDKCIEEYDYMESGKAAMEDKGYFKEVNPLNRHWWTFTGVISRLGKLRRKVSRFMQRYRTDDWQKLYRRVNQDTKRAIRAQKCHDLAGIEMKVTDSVMDHMLQVFTPPEVQEVSIVFNLEDYPPQMASKDVLSRSNNQ